MYGRNFSLFSIVLIPHLLFQHYFHILSCHLSYHVVDLYFRPFRNATLWLEPSIFLIFVKLSSFLSLNYIILHWPRSSLWTVTCFSGSRILLSKSGARGVRAWGRGFANKVSSTRCMRQFNVWILVISLQIDSPLWSCKPLKGFL